MPYIVLIAVIGILLLQWASSIPLSSVGGSMTIGLAVLAAVPAVGIHEAWTKKRGWLDREHRRLARRGFSDRPPRRHGYSNHTQPVYGSVVAGGHGGDRDVCFARRHDGRHAAGIVGRAVDRDRWR